MQKFIVNGSVSHLNLLGGISVKDAPVNADAKLGLVQVGGNWKASSIATGVSAGADGRYGTADDTVLSGFLVKNSPDSVSGIGSIVIGGAVSGGSSWFSLWLRGRLDRESQDQQSALYAAKPARERRSNARPWHDTSRSLLIRRRR